MQVHRFHPPLAYGRTMDTPPETSEGCALCRVAQGPSGKPAYAVITYECALVTFCLNLIACMRLIAATCMRLWVHVTSAECRSRVH